MDKRLALALSGLALIGLFAAQTGPAQAQDQSPPPPPRDIIVATKEAPPFAMKSETGAWSGISIELWNRLAEKLNLHTTFHEYETVP